MSSEEDMEAHWRQGRLLLRNLFRATTITEVVDASEVEVPPTIDRSVADYVIAIDDSGDSASLLDERMQFRVNSQPINLLYAFGLPVKHLNAFNYDWNELRLQIKKQRSLN